MWLHRSTLRLFISTNFEPVGAVEGRPTRTPRCCCPPAEGLFNDRWSRPTTTAAVRFFQKIRLKLLFCEYCLTSCIQAVDRGNSAALVLLELYKQQHSTRSTLRFCFTVCELLSASTTQFTDGVSCICLVDRRTQYVRRGLLESTISPSDVMWCALINLTIITETMKNRKK